MIDPDHKLLAAAILAQVECPIRSDSNIVWIVQYTIIGRFDQQCDSLLFRIIGPDLSIAIVAAARSYEVNQAIVIAIPGSLAAGEYGSSFSMPLET